MKNRIIVKKTVKEVMDNYKFTEKEFLNFYLKNDSGEHWLFQQDFSKGVYEWFKSGRAEGEILSFSKWNKNKRLNNTVKRIPREIRYVQKYVTKEERVA